MPEIYRPYTLSTAINANATMLPHALNPMPTCQQQTATKTRKKKYQYKKPHTNSNPYKQQLTQHVQRPHSAQKSAQIHPMDNPMQHDTYQPSDPNRHQAHQRIHPSSRREIATGTSDAMALARQNPGVEQGQTGRDVRLLWEGDKSGLVDTIAATLDEGGLLFGSRGGVAGTPRPREEKGGT